MEFEMTAGLEVHVELSTKTKIFCGCTTEFEGEPNTHTCPVCTGMPGSLPVLNKSVVEFAVKTGIALNCSITRHNKFDRKNYFYPDLPKAYQISQLYLPICTNGHIDIKTENGFKSIRIHEIHMEEDAGKLIHDDWDDCTLVDYNRCGVPLLEIVSEPDFESAEEIIAYLEKLKEILIYLGVSDCKMQEGSMRADVNISVKPKGTSELGTRTEMKNMSSFKAIYKAVNYETKRQIELIKEGKRVIQQTRRWDENKDASFAMRSKENAQDYRYFPEPDIPPVDIDDMWINNIISYMPELAETKRERYINELGLSEYDASVITSAKPIAMLFEEASEKCKSPKEVCNLIMGELMRLLSDTNTLPENLSISPDKIASLVKLVNEKKINRNVAKEVFEQIFKNDVDPVYYVNEKALMIINDEEFVSDIIKKVLSENVKSVEEYKSGKQKVFGFLVGQSMKALKGKAEPNLVNDILKKMLNEI